MSSKHSATDSSEGDSSITASKPSGTDHSESNTSINTSKRSEAYPTENIRSKASDAVSNSLDTNPKLSPLSPPSGQDSPKKPFWKPNRASMETCPKVQTASSTSQLEISLSSVPLKPDQVKFILNEGEKYLDKPLILSKKLKITKDLATKAMEILKLSKKVSKLELTPQISKKIKTCLEDNPEVDAYDDIALLCEVDEELVSKYFDNLPLTDKQKRLIRERFNLGNSISDISKLLNIKMEKISKYIERNFLTFSNKEGQAVLDIVNEQCGQMSVSDLRKKICSSDLKLQDQLLVVLYRKNEAEYNIVYQYLSTYDEANTFLKVDYNLTMSDISTIKQSSQDSVEQLSIKINKVESVIRHYIHQYHVHLLEAKHNEELQIQQIKKVSRVYGNKSISLDNYRTIITLTFDKIIGIAQSDSKSKKVQDMLDALLPLVFYYLKCSLPFEDIARIIANVSEITLTTHDVFHLVFQLSDPVLRGLCIEHYSFSNPVPLYYPKLKHPQSKSCKVEFEICKELWYCLEQYNGLISFGLGRASWNSVGKSTLLDFIFETDFVKGSPQSSAFHFRSIDIQLTRNLFGGTSKSNSESTKWAYIDCHGYSDFSVIQVLCSHLDVALIHVCYNDYINNKAKLDKELTRIERELKHIYLLLRDCKCDRIIGEARTESKTIIKIPNLTRKDVKHHSIVKSLKEIGYEIFHSTVKYPKLVQSRFVEGVMLGLDSKGVQDIQADKILVQNITRYITMPNKVDFNFLSYYPTFVNFMSSYHKASYETDQDIIEKLNSDREDLSEKLNNISRGNIVDCFNEILRQENSTLILWKLSRELLLKSDTSDSQKKEISNSASKEQKNDKYTLEILWRESLLSQRYGQNTEDKDKDEFEQLLATNFSEHVGSGEAFELIDGDNLRFFNKDIDLLLSQFYKKQDNMLKRQSKIRGTSTKIKPAPIVVSILGPQSSGKSTLLNYCFGCKFLTSAGRCTRGIYASLSKLDRPVNVSQSFLILDTEGLDAIERDNIKDTSMIHFDRTMVLFCLSVSQVVIINVKGDIGSEMQNLLQICAYSLNRLKVSKVKAPKIFFVLNQQADPDPNKHLDAINLLMEKLNSESGFIETGVKLSDLIQVSRENLFILPSAFNSQQMNKPDAKLFDSNVIKLSPTIAFADKCTDLRLAIIDQLDNMPIDDRAPFQNMSEWMDMAGVIWDIIMRYQDIVKYKNLEELICSNKLGGIATKLMKKHIYSHEREFTEKVRTIRTEISSIQTSTDPSTILTEALFKFDDIFIKYQNECFEEFSTICRNDPLLKMQHICNETSSNIKQLIYVVRKQHEDQIKIQINSVLIEIHISGSVDKYVSTCAHNYIELIKSALKFFTQSDVKTFFEKREDSLSHANLLSLANDLLQKELAKKSDREVTDVNNFVVQFICNRNTVLQRLFQEKWDELVLLLYSNISQKIRNKFDHEMSNIKSVMDQFISNLGKNAKGNFQCFNSDQNFELAELNVHDPNDPKIKKLPFKAVTHYLKMYLDPKVPLGKFIKHFGGFEIDGIKVTVSDSFVLCSKPIEPILELETFEKLEKTGMFDSTQLILNIYDYIKQFQVVLEDFRIEIGKNEFKGMIEPFKAEFQKKIFGCPSQCPSCGKFCEREVHTNEGKCQIKTGHQISSMGGKVWNADKDNTAVLFMCDDYKNYTRVTLPCGEMTWGGFKDKCSSEWNWNLPADEMNTSKQLSNQKIMKDVWNKFGRGILNYYETQGTRISYVPYTDSEEVEMWRQRSGGRGSVSSGDLQIFIDYKT